jgi:hypothetical protein
VKFGEVVKKALQWLLVRQDPEGCVGPRGKLDLYNHTIAALALSEAYGMTAAQPLKEPAQKAIDFLVACQNPGLGWSPAAKPAGSDTMVTAWAVLALKSAELSGLAYPKSATDGAMVWIGRATNSDFRIVPAEGTAAHPTLTAAGIVSRIFIQKNRRDPALGGTTFLLADLPEAGAAKTDSTYWYFGSLALYQFDGPSGDAWKKWNEPMKNALVPIQKTAKDGCAKGSWDPAGFEGGRVGATALNGLTLEIYYRYANVFGGQPQK